MYWLTCAYGYAAHWLLLTEKLNALNSTPTPNTFTTSLNLPAAQTGIPRAPWARSHEFSLLNRSLISSEVQKRAKLQVTTGQLPFCFLSHPCRDPEYGHATFLSLLTSSNRFNNTQKYGTVETTCRDPMGGYKWANNPEAFTTEQMWRAAFPQSMACWALTSTCLGNHLHFPVSLPQLGLELDLFPHAYSCRTAACTFSASPTYIQIGLGSHALPSAPWFGHFHCHC